MAPPPTVVGFPGYINRELRGYVIRPLEWKGMWSVGEFKELELFGWQQAIQSGAPTLIITEGHYDAVSAFQVLKDSEKNTKYADFNPAVVSLNHGSASAAKEITRQLGDIQTHFKRVVLAFDMDDAGQKAVADVCKILPIAEAAKLPAKDANEALIEGRSRALKAALLFKSSKPKNTRLVWGRDLHEEAKKPAEWGVPYPWEALTQMTRGIRKGETIYLGAAQKMGKSEIVNKLTAWLIEDVGWKVMTAKPEEANNKSYKMVASKIARKIFHDPKVEFDEEAFDIAGEMLKDNLCMLNLYQHMGWESLKEDIIAAASEGVDAVMIDPITNLTNGMSSGDANTKLQEIAQELAAMARDLDMVIFIFCHLRNPDFGPPHDRGGAVLTSQFAGSRAMGRSCNYMFALQGNKDPELGLEERNCRDLVVLDDREYGEVGTVPLYWDYKTGDFNER